MALGMLSSCHAAYMARFAVVGTTGDMFDIVVDYPDSAPALSDLAACLQHTSLAGHFAATFRGALTARLLHAGAATSDIIHTYVCTIRAMQTVDSSGEGY